MSAGKWTAGTWVADASPMEHGSYIAIRSADDRWIASVNGGHDAPENFPTDAECEANARLIAAAPELAEALERLADYSDSVAYEIGDSASASHGPCDCPRCAARAALAGLRGKP